MEYIKVGKINKKMIKFNFLITNEVIFTYERQVHVKKNHNNDLKQYFNYLKKVIKKPNYIILDVKHKNTVMMIKKVDKNFINVILKLARKGDLKHKKEALKFLIKINKK